MHAAGLRVSLSRVQGDNGDNSNRSASRFLSFPIRKFNEATVHLSSRENTAGLAFAVLPVPSVNVRKALHYLRTLGTITESQLAVCASD